MEPENLDPMPQNIVLLEPIGRVEYELGLLYPLFCGSNHCFEELLLFTGTKTSTTDAPNTSSLAFFKREALGIIGGNRNVNIKRQFLKKKIENRPQAPRCYTSIHVQND